MRVVRDMDALPPGLRFVATVGVFDGMHRGHQRVIAALARAAHVLRATPVVMTFDPHPELVVRGVAPLLLCDPLERLARLDASGVEITIVQPFDEAFRQQSASAFLARLESGRMLAGLVMTPESAFGHDREGTLETVRRLSATDGWHLVEVPTHELRGGRVSSGRIRGLLEAGRLGEARFLLGRQYALAGRVRDSAADDDGPLGPSQPEDAPGRIAVTVSSGAVVPAAGRYLAHVWVGEDAVSGREGAGLRALGPAIATVPAAEAGARAPHTLGVTLRNPASIPGSAWLRIAFERRLGAA